MYAVTSGKLLEIVNPTISGRLQISERGPQIEDVTFYWGWAIAMRKVLDEESVNRNFIQQLNGRLILCHPSGKMHKTQNIAMDCARSIAAGLQVR